MSPDARRVLDRAQTEDDLLTAVTEALSFLGYVWCHPRRSDKAVMMGDPGLPDIIAARAGIAWFIELKSAGGHVSSDQHRWRYELQKDGEEVHWLRYRLWRPADLDAALAELARP